MCTRSRVTCLTVREASFYPRLTKPMKKRDLTTTFTHSDLVNQQILNRSKIKPQTNELQIS